MTGRTVTNRTVTNRTVTNRTVTNGAAGDANRGAGSRALLPVATFVASRAELSGRHPLLDTAEVARRVCARADRTIGVLGVTPTHLRRIDGWMGDAGLVTHPACVTPDRPVIGSVCDPDRAPGLVSAIVGALVGGLPVMPGPRNIVVAHPGSLSPTNLPPAVSWVAIVSSARWATGAQPERLLLADAAGLVAGAMTALDRPVRLVPISPDALPGRLAESWARTPRSVAELLAES